MPIPGLDPAIVAGIHVFSDGKKASRDGRNKSGHDDVRAHFERHALPRVAIGDAINLLLHRTGVGVDLNCDHF